MQLIKSNRHRWTPAAFRGLSQLIAYPKATAWVGVGAVALAATLAPATLAADKPSSAPQNVGIQTGARAEQKAQSVQEQTAEKRRQITSEAVEALRETQNALKALDEKKTADALAALERASGKLTIILARDPKHALAPVEAGAVTHDILADVDAVKALRKEITSAIEDGRLQAARHMITNLASETVLRAISIPLATYPEAIKSAVRLIDKGRIDEAKAVLQTALSTLVVTDRIIPLPVVIAENLLKDAQALAEKPSRTENENKRLAAFLFHARTELNFAEALGYGTKKDFKNLFDELSQIEEKTQGGKSGKGFFDRIKGFLGDTVESSQKESEGKAK